MIFVKKAGSNVGSTLALLAVTILLVIGGSIGFSNLRFDMMSTDTPSAKVLVVGHRGSGLAPENTLAAFRAGLVHSDMLELDVHLSRDGAVIVAHDADAQRTTGKDAAWADMTMEEIQALDAGSWFGSDFAGEKVPTLDEVLDLVAGQTKVLIELKWPNDGIYEGMVSKVIGIVRAHRAESWVVIQTFETAYLTEVIQHAPDIPCYQLIVGALNFPPMYQDRTFHLAQFHPLKGVKGVVGYYPYLSEGFVRRLQADKLAVGAFTVNEMDDVNRVVNMGVDLVITDHPELMSKLRGNK